jgi:hypothetical protein
MNKQFASIRHVRSDIEDLAFTSRSSRESDNVGRLGCIEHDFTEGLEIRTDWGTEAGVVEIRSKHAEFRRRREGR